MKAAVALAAALLGFCASVAWPHEGPRGPSETSAENRAQPREKMPDAKRDFRSLPARPQPGNVVPRNALPRSEPAVLCACAPLKHQA